MKREKNQREAPVEPVGSETVAAFPNEFLLSINRRRNLGSNPKEQLRTVAPSEPSDLAGTMNQGSTT